MLKENNFERGHGAQLKHFSSQLWRCEGKNTSSWYMWWGGSCPLLCSQHPSRLWSCPQQFDLGFSCGNKQRGLTGRSPVDSRCWSRDLPIPGQHSCLSDPPGSVHALSPVTPSGAVCPAALCSNGRVSETLQALIDNTAVPQQLWLRMINP